MGRDDGKMTRKGTGRRRRREIGDEIEAVALVE